MFELEQEALHNALRYLNARRKTRDVAPLLERFADLLLGASSRLAVYGSLAPGQKNTDLLTSLGGSWHAAHLRGRLEAHPWDAYYGYPAFTWDPEGARIPAWLFEAPELDDRWPELDRFEGEGYRRILTPLTVEGGTTVVANVYEGRPR